jgi:hypothetical protein
MQDVFIIYKPKIPSAKPRGFHFAKSFRVEGEQVKTQILRFYEAIPQE